MLKRLFKDSAVYAFSSSVSRGIALLMLPIYTRVLSPESFGILDLVLAAGLLVNLLVGLEVSQAIGRFTVDAASSQEKERWSSVAVTFVITSYAAFLAIGMFFLPAISTSVTQTDDLQLEVGIALLFMASNGLFETLQNLFKWSLESIRYATVSLLFASLSVVAVLFLTLGIELELLGVFLGLLSASLVANAISIYFQRSRIAFLLDLRKLKAMLAYSIPLVPASLAIWASSYIDRVLIAHYLGMESVGVYGVAFQLSTVGLLFMIGIQSALMPIVLSNYKDPGLPASIKRLFRQFVAVSMLGLIMLALLADPIVSWAASDQYRAAGDLLIILMPAALFSRMYVFGPGIAIAQVTHWYIWLNLFGVTINGLVGLYLIPKIGVTGAAIGSLLGAGSSFCCAMVISQRHYHVPHRWGRIVGFGLVAGATITLVYRNESIWFIAIGLGLLGLMTPMLGLFTRSDAAKLVAFIRETWEKTAR